MTAIDNLPDLRPSLLLDFANSGRVDPRIECTRASAATCFGPDGKLRVVPANTPRIDYDPVTGKCLGLLVEEARTNLFTYSADITNAVWGKTNLSLDGSKISVGSADFYKLSEIVTAQPAGKNVRRMFPSTYPVGTALSIKWFFIEGTRRFCNVVMLSGGATASIALDTKTGDFGIRQTGLPGWTWTVVKHLTGVIEVVAKNPSIHAEYPAGTYIDMRPTTAASLAEVGSIGDTYTGDTSQYVYVGPLQMELGAFPTSYIPTESSAVTRAADQVFIEGLAFTGAMSFVQGAALCSYTARSTAGSQIVLQARSATLQSGFAFQFTAAGGARNRALIEPVSGPTPNFNTRPVEASVKYKAGLSWASDKANNVLNGGFISTVTQSIDIGAPQRLGLGGNGYGGSPFTGHIHDASLYARYLQPAQLQRLTA